MQKAKKAYYYVRDEIKHSFDTESNIITAKASDVLREKTGICHAKSNLLAALLRSQQIPAGFCYQHITLADDDSMGYCVHCFNAIFLDGKWIKVDARGNKKGVYAEFSIKKPKLAFAVRPKYDEYFWYGIYARPHKETMDMLDNADGLEYVLNHIPDALSAQPDIAE